MRTRERELVTRSGNNNGVGTGGMMKRMGFKQQGPRVRRGLYHVAGICIATVRKQSRFYQLISIDSTLLRRFRSMLKILFSFLLYELFAIVNICYNQYFT